MEKGFLLADKLIKCPDCGKYLDLLSGRVLIEYFKNDKVICPNCKHNLKLFELLVSVLDEHSALFGMHYQLLGCKHDTIHPIIKTNQFYSINLKKEIGNGKLVNIISINPTPPIGNLPLISAPATYPRNFLFINNELSIYGLSNEGGEDTQYLISYVYAPEKIIDDLSNKLLLEAFQFYVEKDFRNVVLSANSAVEILFSKFFEELFENSLEDENGALSENNEKKLKHFLQDGTTYGYKLYPFFPAMCEILGIEKLNDDIVENLTTLNKDRNKLIHTGSADFTSDPNKVKRELIAAFLAFKYFKLFHSL